MLLFWDVYEIRNASQMLHGVKLRGRIRKFTLENKINCLAENASDEENVVRFALLTDQNPKLVLDFINGLASDMSIAKVLPNVSNPVLSKIKVNDTTRY